MMKYRKMYYEVAEDIGTGGTVLTEAVDFDPDKMQAVADLLATDLTNLATAIGDIETAVSNIKTGLGEGDIQSAVESTYSKYKADIDSGKSACDSIKKNLDEIIVNNKNTSSKIAAALSALGVGGGEGEE